MSRTPPIAFLTVPTLAISVPATVSLGTELAGSTTALTASLGAVTVTSTAGTAGTSFGWTSTVTSTAFTTGGGSAPETVAASRVTYASGASTGNTGYGGALCTPGQLTTLLAVSLSTSRTAYACSLVSATSATSLTWNPTISVTPDSTNAPGLYTATITHSVA